MPHTDSTLTLPPMGTTYKFVGNSCLWTATSSTNKKVLFSYPFYTVCWVCTSSCDFSSLSFPHFSNNMFNLMGVSDNYVTKPHLQFEVFTNWIRRTNYSSCWYNVDDKKGCGGSRISQTGDANPISWGSNLLFGEFFAENCMKIGKKLDKEGVWGRAPPVPPLDPLMYWLINQ